jgi:hypothetical protein
MKKLGITAAVLGLLCIVGSSTVFAQKLYWTASGLLGPFNIQGLIPSYPEARDIKIPVNMWIIDHPKGLILYDTGGNVAISDGQCKTHWTAGMCDFLKPTGPRGCATSSSRIRSGTTWSIASSRSSVTR